MEFVRLISLLIAGISIIGIFISTYSIITGKSPFCDNNTVAKTLQRYLKALGFESEVKATPKVETVTRIIYAIGLEMFICYLIIASFVFR
ncbi:MAG: hypothetical protein ABH873_07065 [Candidatus Firestonebacteria bacterium]